MAIFLKFDRGLRNPLEEPVVKPYHAWLSESACALTLPLSSQLRNCAPAMGVGTEVGTETFGSSISADKHPGKEVAGPEAAVPTATRAAEASAAPMSRATRGRDARSTSTRSMVAHCTTTRRWMAVREAAARPLTPPHAGARTFDSWVTDVLGLVTTGLCQYLRYSVENGHTPETGGRAYSPAPPPSCGMYSLSRKTCNVCLF